MGRKDYMNDLSTAQFLDINHIHDVRSNEDGEFTFTFMGDNGISGPITAMIPDVSEYPKSHEYMLFAADDAPSSIAQAVADAPSTRRKTIPQLLDTISKHISDAIAKGDEDDPFEIDDDGDVRFANTSDGEQDSDDDFDNDGDNEDWALDDDPGLTHIPASKATIKANPITPHQPC